MASRVLLLGEELRHVILIRDKTIPFRRIYQWITTSIIFFKYTVYLPREILFFFASVVRGDFTQILKTKHVFDSKQLVHFFLYFTIVCASHNNAAENPTCHH